MATFPFLPRSVKGKSKVVEPVSVKASTSSTPRLSATATTAKQRQTVRAVTAKAEDIQSIFSLALSSYSLFIAPGARRLLDREEYVRLSTLMANSPILAYLPEGLPEAQIVSALRAFPAASRPDIRIGAEGFELKYKLALLQLTHSEWERRTVYVENVPVQGRTMAAVHKALQHLIPHETDPLASSSLTLEPSIQHISFPPGQNNQGQQERFRGFAFVIFRTEEEADQFVTDWPWDILRRSDKAPANGIDNDSEHEADDSSDEGAHGESANGASTNGKFRSDTIELARRGRFRAVSKAAWVQLKSEYLSEQRRLLQVSRPQPATASVHPRTNENAPSAAPYAPVSVAQPTKRPCVPVPVTQPTKRPFIQEASYPTGCLAFARDLPGQTNKTALKAIFASSLGESLPNGVDYVDWTKGMDTCYVRFSTADDARTAIAYFQQARKSSAAASIRLELIDGEREKIYWEKVPEHLRKQAVERATGRSPAQPDGERPRKKMRGG